MTADPFTTVQGPAKTNDEPANVERDGNGRYRIPKLPADYREQFAAKGHATPDPKDGVTSWTRVTTFVKSVSDTYGLSKWSQRMVAKGLASRPDLYAGAAACQLTDTKTLDNIVEQSKDAAQARAGANLGSAYHSFTEAIDRGENPNIPVEAWRTDLDAFGRLKVEHNMLVKPERIERTVLNTRWNVAGTYDRIYGMNGRSAIVDVKSGKDPAKFSSLEIAIQLLCYATADAEYDWDRKVFLPLPDDLDQNEAWVIHLPPGKAEATLYRVNIGAAVEGANLCMAVREWRNSKNMMVPVTAGAAPVYGTPEPAPAAPAAVQDSTVKVRFNTGGKVAEDVRTKLANGEAVGQLRALVPGSPDSRIKLAPLAGPGQRGCSVCRRTGHKKGSSKCLGDRDPAVLMPELQELQDAIERSGLGPQWCLRTGPCSDAGWTTPERDGGPWTCGSCGKPSRSGQIAGTGVPVAGTKGMPSADQAAYDYAAKTISPEFAAALAPNHRAASVLDRVAEESAVVSGTLDEDLFSSSTGPVADPWTHSKDCPRKDEDHEACPPASVDEDGGDPFADDEPAGPPSWEDRIRAAKTKAEMRAIREEATAAGAWTKALMALGIEQLAGMSGPSK